MRSPRSIFALVAVAALASVFSLTVFAGTAGAEKISARGESRIPPEGCPPGWEKAVSPLNPQLGCLPTEETAAGGGEESDPAGTGGTGGGVDCPEGWVKAVPPLNPALGCIPDTIVAKSGPDFVIDPPVGCPEGTVPATPPLNTVGVGASVVNVPRLIVPSRGTLTNWPVTEPPMTAVKSPGLAKAPVLSMPK